MSQAFKFDPAKAFEPADQIARDQEVTARLLLWDQISDKAAMDEGYRKQLVANPEAVVSREAGALAGGASDAVSKDTVEKLAEKARKTFSSVVPQIAQDRVENLIFGTIEDMRTSFKLTLRLSQVLFYAGLAMVAASFVFALLRGERMITLLFSAGGLASILLSSLVLSPLNRVQDAAGDLVQLQMAYLAYYKQLYLLGSGSDPLPKADAIEFAREIDRAAISLIMSVQNQVEREQKQPLQRSHLPQQEDTKGISEQPEL